MEMEIDNRIKWSFSKVEELISLNTPPQYLSRQIGLKGLTVLSWTILYQRWDLAEKLLKYGIDPNFPSTNGLTALHMVLLTYSLNLSALPTFKPSYYYFYTNKISPLMLHIKPENSSPNFLKTLIRYGAKLIPDEWKMTVLTVARLSRLNLEVQLFEKTLDLSVRDVLEGSTIQNLNKLNPYITHDHNNLVASLKHGIHQPTIQGINLSETINFKLKLFFPFPSTPLRLYLNTRFIPLSPRFELGPYSPAEELNFINNFANYLAIINTGFPSQFIDYFTVDALEVANMELNIITDYLRRIVRCIQITKLQNNDIYTEWFSSIDSVFKTNYIPLLRHDMLSSGTDANYGEYLVYQIIVFLEQTYLSFECDTNLKDFFLKWVENLNSSVCRAQTIISIVISYSKCDMETPRLMYRLIDFLLKYGFDINERSRNNLSTCLHKAVQVNSPKLFSYLLDSNAYLHTVDKRGLTALNMVHMKYPRNKFLFLQNPKVFPPFPLKSLAAQAVSDSGRYKQIPVGYRQISVGHNNSQLNQFLELHLRH